MKSKLVYFAALNFALLMSTKAFAQPEYSAGFIEIEETSETGLEMGIWYPSLAEETVRKWGPFRAQFAWKGEPVSGVFPVIVFSHGLTGRYRNHRDTAATLARSGYVVIAPQHNQDLWIGTSRTVSAIEHRVGELAKALHLVKSHEAIGNIIDGNRTGAIGYSLGSLTVLKAGGSHPSYVRYNAHCKKHGSVDENFCTVIPWWQRVLRWFQKTELSIKDEFTPVQSPLEFQAAALIAPVGAMFAENEISKTKTQMAIYRFGDDEQVKYPFHANYIHKSLRKNKPEYNVYEGVHHYAFISPFPAWLLEEEHIPVALDPEGFDRLDFLKKINADIVRFFEKYLPVNELGK